MRGIPGCGKSTWVDHACKMHGESHVICSADEFRYVDGVYQFVPNDGDGAHRKCLRKFVACVASSSSSNLNVYVDNTNLSIESILPYYRVGRAFDCEVTIVHVIADFETCLQNQKHAVPKDKLLHMWAMVKPINLPEIIVDRRMVS